MRIVKFLLLMIVLFIAAASTQTLPLYAECDEGDYCTIYQWFQQDPEGEQKSSEDVCIDLGICQSEGCSLRDSGFNTGTVWCRCSQGCSECSGGEAEASVKASIERKSPAAPADLFIQSISPPARHEK